MLLTKHMFTYEARVRCSNFFSFREKRANSRLVEKRFKCQVNQAEEEMHPWNTNL